MSNQFTGSAVYGKTDAEIEVLANSVPLSAADKIYCIVRNSFIAEAEEFAKKRAARGYEFDRLFSARMEELMQTQGIPLLKEAGLCR